MNGFFQKWKPWLILAGALVIAVVVIAVLPPGCEQTDKEPIHPDGPPKPPISSLERLRSSWDSEGEAVWPVTELLASMSETAYQSPPAAKMSYGKLGFDRIVPVLAGSLTAFVVSGEDVTVIAFRGTDNPADGLVNLDVVPIQTPHGEMHQGFADAYKKMKAPILDVLRPKPPKHLWVTGHSLGGALAVVCAHDLIDNEKMALDGVITFGQPMVAQKELADYLDKLMLGRFAHLVNDADVVPRLPPSYSHCGSLVWFTEGGIRRSRPKRPLVRAGKDDLINSQDDNPKPLTNAEFEKMKADLKKRSELQRPPDGRPVYQGNIPWIQDHSMSLYIEKVRSFIWHLGQFRLK